MEKLLELQKKLMQALEESKLPEDLKEAIGEIIEETGKKFDYRENVNEILNTIQKKAAQAAMNEIVDNRLHISMDAERRKISHEEWSGNFMFGDFIQAIIFGTAIELIGLIGKNFPEEERRDIDTKLGEHLKALANQEITEGQFLDSLVKALNYRK